MALKKLVESLHNLERKVLPVLQKHKTVPEICAATGLKETEVMRALQWLQNKKIISIKTEVEEVVELDKNGIAFLKQQLPERRFLTALKEKELPIAKLLAKGLTKEELNVCLGIFRQNAAIVISKDKELKVKLTEKGKKLAESELPEERFLRKEFPLSVASLSADEKKVLEALKNRKDIVKVELRKIKTAELLELGKAILAEGIKDEHFIDNLTPEIIASKEWKKKAFRRYDVSINVPRIFGGKKQPYRQFLDWARQKFMALGFSEMTGPIVETEFWNMDALFMPQFHSARDIHDAYYIKEPKFGILDESLVKRVKASHENGFETGSTGWRYAFDVQRTRRHLLRTQGTACSARMLASTNLKIPGKYFGITRCFRKDVIDSTHSVDFYQMEGIVVEEGLNLRHLFGLLEMFAKEFAGADEIKIVPGYFPFTEPSAELFAKHPLLGWVELGGAGIFRPEVVKPLLGKDISVIAWGIGIDRIGMFKLGIKDIRQLFTHDIVFLRNAKVV